ncbi:MAG: Hsp20/alpha crystallin family protein [Nanoarchaeota archaeon]|nr:Hsp20/alpha crystallin family protein [Nanoarchaeota archaeon]
MGFFDDDPFEELVREFFSNRRGNGNEPVIEGEEEERTIDFIESDDRIFFIFELPGFSEKDIDVDVKDGKLIVVAKRKNIECCQDYLTQKLKNGTVFRKSLPRFVNIKNFDYTFRNGILEVVFLRR